LASVNMTNTTCTGPGCKNPAKVFALVIGAQGIANEEALCNEHVRSLGMDYLLRNPLTVDNPELGLGNEQCYLYGVLFEYEPQQFTIVLRAKESPSVLVVRTGYNEASAIYNYAKKVPCANPPPHVLIIAILESLGGSISEAVVYGYDKHTDSYQT